MKTRNVKRETALLARRRPVRRLARRIELCNAANGDS